MAQVGENSVMVTVDELRENGVMVTADELREHPKERYRPFFVALHGSAKRWPGGITELAQIIGRNPRVLADKLNPNLLDKVPQLEEVLFTLEMVQSPAALNALCLIAGRISVPVQVSDRAPREVVSSFLALVERTSALVGRAADAVADGRVDADERAEILPLIDELLTHAVAFQSVIKGG